MPCTSNRLASILIILILVSCIIPILPSNTMAGMGDLNIYYPDDDLTGTIYCTDPTFSKCLAGLGNETVFNNTDSIYVGRYTPGGAPTENYSVGFVSFNTSAIPDDYRVVDSTFYIRFKEAVVTGGSPVHYYLYRHDYGDTLTTADYPVPDYSNVDPECEGLTLGSPFTTPEGQWQSANLNCSAINITGHTQYVLNSTTGGFGKELVTYYSSTSDYSPYLLINAITDNGLMVYYNFSSSSFFDNYTTTLYPIESIDYGTAIQYMYELQGLWDSDDDAIDVVTPSSDWSYISSNLDPLWVSTADNRSYSINHYSNMTIHLWFTVPSNSPKTTAFIDPYHFTKGDGLDFDKYRIYVNEGSWYNSTTATRIYEREIEVDYGNTYCLAAMDYFGNVVTNTSFIASDLWIDVPFAIPMYEINVHNIGVDYVVDTRIWYNATGNPYEFHVSPGQEKSIISQNGTFMFAFTYLYQNSTKIVTDLTTEWYNLTINGTYTITVGTNKISIMYTTTSGTAITVDIIETWVTPSILNIYYELPVVPVDGTRTTQTVEGYGFLYRHPYMIMEASVTDTVTGTSGTFETPLPSAGTTEFLTDYIYISGDYNTHIMLNFTGNGTNFYNSTSNPGIIDLTTYNNATNVTIWANSTVTAIRQGVMRQSVIFYWQYYPHNGLYTVSLKLNNTGSFNWRNVYWYVAFADTDADNVPADTTTVTVYDAENARFLNVGQHYDISQGGIAMVFDYINSSVNRTFTFRYFLINNTPEAGMPIINIRQYMAGDFGGQDMYYGAGTWVNDGTTSYKGDILISLKNLDGLIDYNQVHVTDIGSEYVLSDDQFVFSGNSVTINYEAVGEVGVGSSRSYKIYFMYQDIDVDDTGWFKSWYRIGFLDINAMLLVLVAACYFGIYGIAEIVTSLKQQDEARGFGYLLIAGVLACFYFLALIFHAMGMV